MYNDIISQNVKLMDEKLIISGKKFEIIKGVKYLVYYVSKQFEPILCEQCGCLVHRIK